MIKNFEEVKQQLRELAEIVNSFKSEAVQLRLVELVFGGVINVDQAPSPDGGTESHKEARARTRRTKPAAAPTNGAAGGRPAKSGRIGGKAALSRLFDEGFFKSAKTINDIVQHADTNLATRLKQSDFSGALARYVRDGKLKRTKNADNQYEYVQA